MAFQGSKSPRTKRVTMIRASMRAPLEYRPRLVVKTDYNITADEAPSEYHDSGTLWDVGDWDTSSWGGSADRNIKWQVTTGLGHTFAPALFVSSDVQLTLNTIDMMFEEGGPL